MLFFAAIILPLIFFPKKLVLGRKEGVIILLFYSYLCLSTILLNIKKTLIKEGFFIKDL